MVRKGILTQQAEVALGVIVPFVVVKTGQQVGKKIDLVIKRIVKNKIRIK